MALKLSPEKRKALEQILMAEAARKGNYTEYCRLVYSNGWRPAKHHLLISEHIEAVMRGELKRLMVFMPPRHGKSMQITHTLPSFFLGHNPDKKVISMSYNDDLAVESGLSNRRIASEYGRELFGISVARNPSAAKNWGIEKRQGRMWSAGFGGGVTGRGADLLIIDDPVKNRMEAESKPTRDSLHAEYKSTAYTRLQGGAAIIIIMTRWHEDDLSGRILASEDGPNWTVLSIPAISESENDLLHRDIGEPLWPEGGFGLNELNSIRIVVGSYDFAAMYQQRPAPLEGGLFKREWWKWYDTAPEMVAKIISVDAAFKGGDNNDFVSIQCWGKRNANMYLLDCDTRHLDFPQTMQAIRAMHDKYPDVRAIYIEDKANGPAIVTMLQSEIPGVIAVNPDGGKEARAHAVSGAIESGNVYLPRNSIGEELMVEASSFPNGAHDDRVDAMTQAINQLWKHWAEVEEHYNAVQWEPDMWEDFYNANTKQERQRMIDKWGDPFGK